MHRSPVALPYRTSARCPADAPDPDVMRFGARVRRARRTRQTLAMVVVALAFALCFIPLTALRPTVHVVPLPGPVPGQLQVRVVLPGPWLCPVYPGDPSGEREKGILSGRDLYGIDCSQGPWY
jgi:hypothetical protein